MVDVIINVAEWVGLLILGAVLLFYFDYLTGGRMRYLGIALLRPQDWMRGRWLRPQDCMGTNSVNGGPCFFCLAAARLPEPRDDGVLYDLSQVGTVPRAYLWREWLRPRRSRR
jgi:hypothetical protein